MGEQTTPVIYYRDAGFLITNSKAKSPIKTYRIDKIEKVSLRRDPFWIAAAFTVFVALFIFNFGFAFGFSLYVLLFLAITVTWVASRLGLLFVTSKAVSELAFFGLYARLAEVREAIERAMHKEDADEGLATNDADDDE